MARNEYNILLISDDSYLLRTQKDVLSGAGYEPTTTTTDKIETTAQGNRFNLVILELQQSADTLNRVNRVKRCCPHAVIIVVVEQRSGEEAIVAIRAGASDYLIKPVNPEILKFTVEHTLAADRLLRENRELKGYVELYNACQRITTQVEADGVRAASLEALAGELGCRAGLYLERTSITDRPRIKSVLGAEKDQSVWLAKEIAEFVLPEQLAERAIKFYDPIPETGDDSGTLQKEGFVAAMAVHLIEGSNNYGTIVLLKHENDPPFTSRAGDVAKFISRHTILGWQNVDRYASVQSIAYQDQLTGLYNSLYLEMATDREIAQYHEHGRPFSVLFLDLDHFKAVNDTYGHLVGSQLLVEVGKVLKRCVRDEDIVVRYGGDEYTILLRDTKLAAAMKVAERIRRSLDNHTFLGREGLHVHITTCIGVAAFPFHASTTQEIIHMADKAMYRGKAGTRNVVYRADPLVDRDGVIVGRPTIVDEPSGKEQ